MKKILFLMLLGFISACASNNQEVRNTNNVAYYRSSNTCNTCTTSYTVRKPVEVIYKNTTYTTVYEPKTYTSTSYEKRPYNKCDNSDLCY